MLCVPRSSEVSGLLGLIRDGDPLALPRLINYASDRLRDLAHGMLRTSQVRRWEQSDDLLQQTLVRLQRSLRETPICDKAGLLALAALEMRHALVDLARHYFGPLGLGTNHHTDEEGRSSRPSHIFVSAATSAAAQALRWERLYLAIDALPVEEQQVVDLLWIHRVTKVEAASLLGVDRKTIGRRWNRARLALYDLLRDELPQFA